MCKEHFVGNIVLNIWMTKPDNSKFQQDGTSPYWSFAMRRFLNRTLPQRVDRTWITICHFTIDHPRLSYITRCDFLFLGLCERCVLKLPMPRNVEELKIRIAGAFKTSIVSLPICYWGFGMKWNIGWVLWWFVRLG